MSNNKRILIVVLCVLVLVVGMACAWYFGYYAPRQAQLEAKGENEITITVVVTHSDGTKKEFILNTDKTYLGEALAEADFVVGHDDAYGLWIDAMDGETAYQSENKAWCFNINGVMGETGASQTIMNDGDVYEFYVLTW